MLARGQTSANQPDRSTGEIPVGGFFMAQVAVIH